MQMPFTWHLGLNWGDNDPHEMFFNQDSHHQSKEQELDLLR